tara:strand:- start:3841 stop:4026 length:186 start_codon:yes stop_codon:yes gene_type:complete
MTTALIFAAFKGLSAANTQLVLAIFLAISEVLGADPRVRANGIVSFIIIQAQKLLESKTTK